MHNPFYTLTVNGGSGSGAYHKLTPVTVIADVPGGAMFTRWTGDTSILLNTTAASTEAIIPAWNTSITSTYQWLRTLTVINGTGSSTSLPGSRVTITADILQSAPFLAWTGDTYAITSAGGDIHNRVTTVLMPDADVWLAADYDWLNTSSSSSSSLSSSSSSSQSSNSSSSSSLIYPWSRLTVNRGTGSGVYRVDTPVPVAATIGGMEVFRDWTGNTEYLLDPSQTSTTFYMPNQTATLTARVWTKYTITVNSGIVTVTPVASGESGSGTGSAVVFEHAKTAPTSQVLQLTANVVPSADFSHWIGDTQYLSSSVSAITYIVDAAGGSTHGMPSRALTFTAVYNFNVSSSSSYSSASSNSSSSMSSPSSASSASSDSSSSYSSASSPSSASSMSSPSSASSESSYEGMHYSIAGLSYTPGNISTYVKNTSKEYVSWDGGAYTLSFVTGGTRNMWHAQTDAHYDCYIAYNESGSYWNIIGKDRVSGYATMLAFIYTATSSINPPLGEWAPSGTVSVVA